MSTSRRMLLINNDDDNMKNIYIEYDHTEKTIITTIEEFLSQIEESPMELYNDIVRAYNGTNYSEFIQKYRIYLIDHKKRCSSIAGEFEFIKTYIDSFEWVYGMTMKASSSYYVRINTNSDGTATFSYVSSPK